MLDIKTCYPSYFTNWYNFLGINTTGFIETLDEWKQECKTRCITNTNKYMKLCAIDKRFPNMPDDFYNDFTNLFSVLSQNSENANKYMML